MRESVVTRGRCLCEMHALSSRHCERRLAALAVPAIVNDAVGAANVVQRPVAEQRDDRFAAVLMALAPGGLAVVDAVLSCQRARHDRDLSQLLRLQTAHLSPRTPAPCAFRYGRSFGNRFV